MRKFLMAAIVLLVFLMGCKQKVVFYDPIPDEIIGTWVHIIPGGGEIPHQIMQYSFMKTDSLTGEGSFQWKIKRQQDSAYIVVSAIAGDLGIEGDRITITTTKAGSMQSKPMSDTFDDTITWYYPSDKEFNRFPKKESFVYEIDGEILKIKTDENGDGDFNDQDEVVDYRRIRE